MTLFTADQLIAHAVGDYVLQSDWMANEKTKKNTAALIHALTYMLPFHFLTDMSMPAFLVMMWTHFIIDRLRLARYVCWFKNWVGSPDSAKSPPWSECTGTGYPQEKPAWMAVWLMIITDNLMHVTINALALRYL